MQIESNYNAGAVHRTPPSTPATKTVRPAAEAPAFQDAEKLNAALKDTPDVRADKVDKAKALIKEIEWPPTEVINRISKLVAAHYNNPTQPE
jgi:hypothetical protein